MSYIEKDLRRAAKMDRSCWTSELLIAAADRIAELEAKIVTDEQIERMAQAGASYTVTANFDGLDPDSQHHEFCAQLEHHRNLARVMADELAAIHSAALQK